MLTREEAWRHLCDWTKTDSLRKHARAVEIVMRRAAHEYGAGDADEEKWAVAGLLHDADYEQWPEEHPNRTVRWLRERGEEEIAQKSLKYIMMAFSIDKEKAKRLIDSMD